MPSAQRTNAGRLARWYVVQVERGRERFMAERLTRVVPASLLAEPVFQPKFETEIKVRGSYVRVAKPILDGYLIAATSDAEGLGKFLAKHVVEFTRLLGTASGPAPLSAEETELMGGLGTSGNRVVPMSLAYRDAEGATTIVSGPLKGYEHLIADINRRKSTAYLELPFCGQTVRAKAGLAVFSESAYAAVSQKALVA